MEPATNNQHTPPAQQSTQPQQQTPPATAQQPQAAPAVDYDKIQQMLNGTLAAKEDTALKAYFKQQGLSQDEMAQAIEAFKQQKAANQPDVGALQTQLQQARAAAQSAAIENTATVQAFALFFSVGNLCITEIFHAN